MSTIYPDRHVFTFEFIECENGDIRYRFSQRAVADPLTTRSTIIIHAGETPRAHMIVAHRRPGNTKHGFRVDEDVSLPIARHIIGHWAALAEHTAPIPFPDF